MIPFLMKMTAALALAAADLLAAGAAQAQVTCSVVAMPWNLTFGEHTHTVNDATASSPLQMACQNPSATARRVMICVALDAGTGGVDGAWRLLTSGSNSIHFQLYRNAARTQRFGIWPGDNASHIRTIAANTTLPQFNTNIRIYGRIPAGQTPKPVGSYISEFGGGHTRINYGDYGLNDPPPACESLPNQLAPAFAARVDVTSTCEVAVHAHVDFGAHSTLTSAVDTKGALKVECTPNHPYRIALGDGQSAQGGQRHMRHVTDGHLLKYELYQNPGLTQRWGSAGSELLGVPGGSTGPTYYDIFARAFAQTAPATGVYRDSVVVEVQY